MTPEWFRIREDGGLESTDPSIASGMWKRGEAVFWVDVVGWEAEELDAWLQALGVSEPARQCCLATDDSPRAVPLEGAAFFQFPVFQGEADSELANLAFLCLERLVVTLHEKPVAELAKLAETLRRPGGARVETTAAVVSVVLLTLSTQTSRIARSLRDAVYALDERMDREEDDIDVADILERKRNVRDLDTVVDERLALVGVIEALRLPYLDMRASSESFGVMSRTLLVSQRAVDRLEKHLSDLQVRYDASRQEKTNQRLAILTVISAIFLPLTLFTGIYGMNFENMPELALPYSYPVALGVMASIAGGLYWYFRNNGWLD